MFLLKQTRSYDNGLTKSSYFVKMSLLGVEFTSHKSLAKQFPTAEEASKVMNRLKGNPNTLYKVVRLVKK